MELALQFENLNCEELCAIDGGSKAHDIGYQVGKLRIYIKQFLASYHI